MRVLDSLVTGLVHTYMAARTVAWLAGACCSGKHSYGLMLEVAITTLAPVSVFENNASV